MPFLEAKAALQSQESGTSDSGIRVRGLSNEMRAINSLGFAGVLANLAVGYKLGVVARHDCDWKLDV
jgi:hypothetical protein